jgi:CarboxypepD_reg-like domain
MMKKPLFLALFLALSIAKFMAQNTVVFGRILDASTNEGVEAALIIIESEKISAESDQFGNYSINVKADTPLIIKFSRLGYDDVTYTQYLSITRYHRSWSDCDGSPHR